MTDLDMTDLIKEGTVVEFLSSVVGTEDFFPDEEVFVAKRGDRGRVMCTMENGDMLVNLSHRTNMFTWVAANNVVVVNNRDLN